MLAWLVDQVQKLWDRISSNLSSAYSYAVSKANAALVAAKTWATSAIASARAALQSGIDAARSLASSLYNAAKAFATDLYEAAKSYASSLYSAAKSFATSLYNQALGWIDNRVNWLRAKITDATNWLKDWVHNLVDNLVKWFNARKEALVAVLAWFASGVPALWDWLKKLPEILTPANLTALVDFFSRIYAWLVGFLANPVGYIAAFVMSFFLDMFCDVVAHGMGTLKYDLPPMRSYGLGGTGGAFPTGPGPGPGASGLAAPLDHLYVSGYRFGPGHPGLDLGLSMGSQVYAMHDGTVLEAGWNPSGYGFDVVLEGGGWWSRYGHLQQPFVQRGDRVQQSQPIGAGDSTGNSTGPHLHLEIKWQGKFVDPVTVLPL